MSAAVMVPASLHAPESGGRRRWRPWHVAFYLVLALVYGVFVVSTIPGVRPEPGYNLLLDGFLNNLAYMLSAVLCLVRAREAVAYRSAWRVLGVGLACDVAVTLHAVNETGHGRGLDLLGLGELAHPPRPGEDQHGQRRESGSGDPERLVLHAQASQQVDRGRVQAIGHRIHISR